MIQPSRLFVLVTFVFFTQEAFGLVTLESKAKLNNGWIGTNPVRFLQNGNGRYSYRTFSKLFYRDRDDMEEALTDTRTLNEPKRSSPSVTKRKSGVSMPLIRAIWYNQAAILLFATAMVAIGSQVVGGGAVTFSNLHWNTSPFHSFFDWNVSPMRIWEGVIAAVPMVAVGSLVENSDRRDASHVNFSTTNMVISLFGRRKSEDDPDGTNALHVMSLSSVIAVATGLSEELVFRGYVPAAIAGLTHSIPLAFIGQALLFALAHISPRSSASENKVVSCLQFANGLWYGMVYLMAGGDILPCILAHVLYDMHVIFETWTAINNQMDYTQKAFQKPMVKSEEEAIERIKMQAGPSLNVDTLNFARRFFYAFDYERKGSLSLSDTQRAVSYAFLKDKVAPSPQKVAETFNKVLENRQHSHMTYLPPDRLSVSEFLRLLFTLRSKAWSE